MYSKLRAYTVNLYVGFMNDFIFIQIQKMYTLMKRLVLFDESHINSTWDVEESAVTLNTLMDMGKSMITVTYSNPETYMDKNEFFAIFNIFGFLVLVFD